MANDDQTDDQAKELGERLRARSAEIEARILASLHELYELAPGTRTEVIAGAQVVVPDVLSFSISAFEQGEAWSEPMPQSYAEGALFVAQRNAVEPVYALADPVESEWRDAGSGGSDEPDQLL